MSIQIGQVGSVMPSPGELLNRAHPAAQGLVGCWPLVAGMGTLVADHSGNGYHGTLTNMAGTEWTPSPYGWALNFPGSDDYVGVAGTSPLLKITGSMTCAALFLMPAAPGIPYVLCKTVSAYTYLLQITGASQTFSFRTNLGIVSGPGAAGGFTPYVGKWILMAGRYDGAYQQVSVVKDGLITSWGSALSGALTANNDAFSIGNRAGQTNALLSPIVCAWVWDRYKTDRTLIELWERPWDMWSRPRRLWYVPTGTGAQTASANAATRTAQAFAPSAIPGAVAVSAELAARVAAAFASAATPGAVTTSPAIAARTAIAFEAGATPGAVTAIAGLASRIAAAFDASGLPGSVTILPGVSARSAQAFAASASVGAATAYPGSIARTAVAFAPTATGGAISVDAGFAARVAEAFAAVASTSSAATGMRDTLVLIDLRDGLLLVDLRDVLNLQ